MKAKKKPLDTTNMEALGVSAAPGLKTVKTEPAGAAPEGRDGEGCRGAGRCAEEKGCDLMNKILIVGEHDGKTLNPSIARVRDLRHSHS